MDSALLSLPGGDLVEVGLRDLAARAVTDESLLVSIGRPRLVQLGLDVPAGFDDPECRLYDRLSNRFGDAAHGRYNALVRRLVSFERALHAPARRRRAPARRSTRPRSGLRLTPR